MKQYYILATLLSLSSILQGAVIGPESDFTRQLKTNATQSGWQNALGIVSLSGTNEFLTTNKVGTIAFSNATVYVHTNYLPNLQASSINLSNWSGFPTNVWNSRQGGSSVLTNLANNPITDYTNRLTAGTGISLHTNSSGVVIISNSVTAGGSGITTNANQFLGAPLSIVSGVYVTNMNHWKDLNLYSKDIRLASTNSHRITWFDPGAAFGDPPRALEIGGLNSGFATATNGGDLFLLGGYAYADALLVGGSVFIRGGAAQGVGTSGNIYIASPTDGGGTNGNVILGADPTNGNNIGMIGLNTNYATWPVDAVGPMRLHSLTASRILVSDASKGITNSAYNVTDFALANWTNVAMLGSANLTNWSLYSTNVWNSRQGGSALLTNLANNPIVDYTNRLTAGTGISLHTNSSGVVIISNSVASSSGLTTNANQFLGVPLSVKAIPYFTNVVNFGSGFTNYADFVFGVPSSGAGVSYNIKGSDGYNDGMGTPQAGGSVKLIAGVGVNSGSGGDVTIQGNDGGNGGRVYIVNGNIGTGVNEGTIYIGSSSTGQRSGGIVDITGAINLYGKTPSRFAVIDSNGYLTNGNYSESALFTGLQTNANQFGAQTVLTIKDTALLTNVVLFGGVYQGAVTNRVTANNTNIFASFTNANQYIAITNTVPIFFGFTNMPLGGTNANLTVFLDAGQTNRVVYLDSALRGYDTNSSPFTIPSNKVWVVTAMNYGSASSNVCVSINPQTR